MSVLGLSLIFSAQFAEIDPAPVSDERVTIEFTEKSDYEWKQRRGRRVFAACLLDTNEEMSRLMMQSGDFMKVDQYRLARELDTISEKMGWATCMRKAQAHGFMDDRLHLREIRRWLAEAIYLSDNPDQVTKDGLIQEYVSDRPYAAGRDPVAVNMAEMADCIVFNAHTVSDSLVRTKTGSRQEKRALKALTPALTKCLGSNITSAPVDIGLMRALVADGLWARSQSEEAGSPTSNGKMKDDDA